MRKFDSDPSKLLNGLYEAALDSSMWEQALRNLYDYTPTKGIVFSCCELSRLEQEESTILIDLDRASWEMYRKEHIGICPRTKYSMTNPNAKVLYDYLHSDEDDMKNSEYYSLIQQHWGTKYYMGFSVPISNTLFANLGVNRSRMQGHPQKHDIQFLGAIRPHVHRALQLSYRQVFHDSKETIISKSSTHQSEGIIAVNRHSQVIYMNDQAAKIINQNDGLDIDKSYLQAKLHYDNQKLQKMVRAINNGPAISHAGSGGALLINRPSGLKEYQMLLSPLPKNSGAGLFGAAAVMFISDPAQVGALPPNHLEQLFGLTPKEAELLYEITRFTSLDNASKEMGISKHTARVHLKSIFYKTGTNSQAELVKLALSH